MKKERVISLHSLSRLERKKIRTKELIFQAAVDLFREKGFDNTSVEEITERADVAKGTFFNYFARKEALLAFLGEKRMEAILAIVQSRLGPDGYRDCLPSGGARDSLRIIFETLGAENEKDKSLVKLIVWESMKKAGVPEVDEKKEDLRRTIQYIVEKGQKSGEFSSSVPAGKLAQILVAVYFHSLMLWLAGGEGFSLRDDLAEKLEIILKVLA